MPKRISNSSVSAARSELLIPTTIFILGGNTHDRKNSPESPQPSYPAQSLNMNREAISRTVPVAVFEISVPTVRIWEAFLGITSSLPMTNPYDQGWYQR